MKKKYKNASMTALKIMLVVFCVYLLFVFIDFSRLKNSERGTKPLICIKEEVEEYSQKYWGLGYSVKYYEVVEEEQRDGIEYVGIYGTGSEYRVFGILMWDYCE